MLYELRYKHKDCSIPTTFYYPERSYSAAKQAYHLYKSKLYSDSIDPRSVHLSKVNEYDSGYMWGYNRSN